MIHKLFKCLCPAKMMKSRKWRKYSLISLGDSLDLFVGTFKGWTLWSLFKVFTKMCPSDVRNLSKVCLFQGTRLIFQISNIRSYYFYWIIYFSWPWVGENWLWWKNQSASRIFTAIQCGERRPMGYCEGNHIQYQTYE